MTNGPNHAKVYGAGMALAFEFIGYMAVTGIIGYFVDRYFGWNGWAMAGGFTIGIALGIWHLFRRMPMMAKLGSMRTERKATPQERMNDVTKGLADVESRIDREFRRKKHTPDEP